MSQVPQISVVMGVHNGQAALIPTLDSVFNQTGADFECVVVDDGSTDSTWKLLQEISATESRLRLHQQPHSGLTRALITGCTLARGEFIARQDIGDFSFPGRLQKQQQLLMSNPGLHFVACQFISTGPKGELLGEPEAADGGQAIIESLRGNPVSGMRGPHHGSVMFRRSAYERVGGYRPEFYFAQDLDLWTRLIEVGDLAFVNEVLYQVQFSPGSITALHRPEQQKLRGLIREATIARRRGEPETEVLRQAAKIRPGGQINDRLGNAEADYFIGSCLHRRHDPAAATYLRRVIKAKPFHLKAWAKLFSSRMLHQA